MTDKHLTPKQLADRLGLPGVQAVYLMNHRGTAPPRIRVGRLIRYRLADVVAWEKSRLAGGAS